MKRSENMVLKIAFRLSFNFFEYYGIRLQATALKSIILSVLRSICIFYCGTAFASCKSYAKIVPGLDFF